MGFWDTITDAVKSLPEAAVLREHVAFLRDKFVTLEKSLFNSESENAVLKAKVAELEAENRDLKLENANLKEQIRDLQEQLSERSRDRLEPLKERILKFLVSNPHVTSFRVAQAVNIDPILATRHLEQMEDKNKHLVARRQIQDEEDTWCIIQDGREYLVTHGLL